MAEQTQARISSTTTTGSWALLSSRPGSRRDERVTRLVEQVRRLQSSSTRSRAMTSGLGRVRTGQS